ncbi:MAG: ATP:cob(I)alamin adenosyltransferase [Chloroflexi bacterium GWB2_49_20]|nr:MAG: ATP:cob(I)alamin adenosyltransferase [Chloroflexi bacterium GWB2_49_20]OGN79907.1 MAG: ATP:cob(I)alamin adenosyltransferase [Chloroflexi bacterium GWC2_49_37]OGN85558.1 MAG: ATP:cob(I)alamin adenosyltransferase [Chloroflexi bacterium GWD2_49_16]HBG74434.1 cob(I)yrinic acid a,c-diamide adenosyltransferase [Anaerolineae bacterium]HCC79599.1 cob(I)yrinic acid a,c-diamide adenosyltransferase [Anaerolineae bacterium]
MPTFFTRTGDDGKTGWLGEGRISKTHPRIETLGSLDEATAALGLVRASCQDSRIRELILVVQRDLYHMMTEVAAAPGNTERFQNLDETRVTWLETQVEVFTSIVQVPQEFILPGDTPSGAAFSLARTIVRRAERRLAELQEQEEIRNPILLHYLNRLSSLCFILELYEIQSVGNPATLAKGESK